MQNRKADTNVFGYEESLPAGYVTAKLKKSVTWSLDTNRGINKQTAVRDWAEDQNKIEEPFPNDDLELGQSPTYQQVIVKPFYYDPADNIARLRVRVMNRMKEAREKFKSPE